MGLPASSQAGLMVNAHMIDALLMKTDLSATCSPAHILQRSVSPEPSLVLARRTYRRPKPNWVCLSSRLMLVVLSFLINQREGWNSSGSV
jgi:hypothetical protein